MSGRSRSSAHRTVSPQCQSVQVAPESRELVTEALAVFWRERGAGGRSAVQRKGGLRGKHAEVLSVCVRACMRFLSVIGRCQAACTLEDLPAAFPPILESSSPCPAAGGRAGPSSLPSAPWKTPIAHPTPIQPQVSASSGIPSHSRAGQSCACPVRMADADARLCCCLSSFVRPRPTRSTAVSPCSQWPEATRSSRRRSDLLVCTVCSGESAQSEGAGDERERQGYPTRPGPGRIAAWATAQAEAEATVWHGMARRSVSTSAAQSTQSPAAAGLLNRTCIISKWSRACEG